MNDFGFYFTLGWEHIISWQALDHLLFILALTAVYSLTDLKKLLILVTAFTLGHSLTLALSVYDLIRVPSSLVEFVIPLTIVITALINVFSRVLTKRGMSYQYGIALFFGLIHGMGFANSIRFMLNPKESILIPLAGFNVGLETGQVTVVMIILAAGYFLINKAGLKQRSWILAMSSLALAAGLWMCWTRLPITLRN